MSADTIRAIRFEAPYRVRAVRVDAPRPPAPGHALVRTRSVGVCGTDASAYRGAFPFFDFPRIPGHELGVEVLEVGDGVTSVGPGDACSVEPYLHCGRCYACRRGRNNCCERLSVIGVMQDGGLRDRFTLPAGKLHRAAGLTFDQLALVETLAIGCHAAARAAPAADDHVLIIGLGPIGLAALEFVRLIAPRVTVMDRLPARVDFCRDTYGPAGGAVIAGDGAELRRLRDRSDGRMFDVVIDATGNPQSMAAALTCAAHGGTAVLLGLTRQKIAFAQPEMHRRELTLLATRNALPADFRQVIDAIAAGAIDTGPWITHRIAFDEVERRFDALTRPETGVLKAVIELDR